MGTTPTNLSKSTVANAVFENIYDRIEDNVKTVVMADARTITVQTYTGSFPDKNIDSKSNYPIIIINPPTMNWDDFTFTKKTVNGSFSIDVLTIQSESADMFLDAILSSIETYREDLRGAGMINVNLTNTNIDQSFRGSFKVHLRTCTFEFKYIFDKTVAY